MESVCIFCDTRLILMTDAGNKNSIQFAKLRANPLCRVVHQTLLITLFDHNGYSVSYGKGIDGVAFASDLTSVFGGDIS